jgi:hypothetical protein
MLKNKLGPGLGKKKDQPRTKIGSGKDGQTIAAAGYKMEITPKKGEPSSKTLTVGRASTKVPSGIYAPKPVVPAKKVAEAPKAKPKKSGYTAVGKALRNVKDAVTPDKTTYKMKGRGRGAGALKCYKY